MTYPSFDFTKIHKFTYNYRRCIIIVAFSEILFYANENSSTSLRKCDFNDFRSLKFNSFRFRQTTKRLCRTSKYSNFRVSTMSLQTQSLFIGNFYKCSFIQSLSFGTDIRLWDYSSDIWATAVDEMGM